MERSIPTHTQLVKSQFGPTVEGTITCAVCRAVYAPSRFHTYLLQAPPIVLESTFISMCHFCFRCRRPACPDCWDDIHAICAQCAHETHVPFQGKNAMLKEGTSPHAPSSSPPDHVAASPTPIIITSSVVDIDSIKTRPERPIAPDIDNIKTRPERLTTSSKRSQPGHIILSLTLALVFLIVLVIVVSLLSVDVNMFIYNTVHIDIRAQLSSLWHFLSTLF